MENTLALDLNACTNCGAVASKHYCANCGQKQRTPHELRITHFLAHALEEFTHLDSKIFRSVAYVLFRPGKLTAEWIEGRERSYVRPLQLFLVMNVVYFLFLQIFPVNTFTTPLAIHYYDQTYSPLIRPIVDSRVKNAHVSFERFSEVFDEAAKLQAKSLVIVMAPMLACVLALLTIGARRYYVEHLVFSLHFYSFFLVMVSGVALIFFSLGRWFVPKIGISNESISWDHTFSLFALAVMAWYFFSALRKVYDFSWPRIAISAVVLSCTAGVLVFVYRFILFFTTIYTMHVH
jgi:hypothetical protein